MIWLSTKIYLKDIGKVLSAIQNLQISDQWAGTGALLGKGKINRFPLT